MVGQPLYASQALRLSTTTNQRSAASLMARFQQIRGSNNKVFGKALLPGCPLPSQLTIQKQAWDVRGMTDNRAVNNADGVPTSGEESRPGEQVALFSLCFQSHKYRLQARAPKVSKVTSFKKMPLLCRNPQVGMPSFTDALSNYSRILHAI